MIDAGRASIVYEEKHVSQFIIYNPLESHERRRRNRMRVSQEKKHQQSRNATASEKRWKAKTEKKTDREGRKKELSELHECGEKCYW